MRGRFGVCVKRVSGVMMQELFFTAKPLLIVCVYFVIGELVYSFCAWARQEGSFSRAQHLIIVVQWPFVVLLCIWLVFRFLIVCIVRGI